MSKIISKLAKSDIFSHVSSLKYLPRWIVLIMDLLLCLVAYYMSFFLCAKMLLIDSLVSLPFGLRIIILLLIQTGAFWVFHTYSGVLRYSGYIDAFKILSAVLVAAIVLFFINLLSWSCGSQFIYYNLGLLLYVCFAFVLLFLLRIVVKTGFEFALMNLQSVTRVMIYGTKSAGVSIGKMIRSSIDGNYRLVGFINDDETYSKQLILGVKSYHKDDDLIRVIKKLGVKSIIVSPRKLKEINPTVDLDIFINNNVNILTAPYVTEWKEQEEEIPRIGAIQSIQIEDLLERPCIQIDLKGIQQFLHPSVVMITGAAGSIGSELVRQIAKYEPRLIVLLDQAESPMHELGLDLKRDFPKLNFSFCIADVRNRQRIDEIVEIYRPDVIYHAAAYKHVPLMEDNPSESILANVLGTKNMADVAVKYGVKRFVMISTDKAVNPTNVMGASKRIAEIYVQSLFKKLVQENPDTTKFITTRFGNVLGSNGSVIPYFKKQIEQGGPVTVTHPEIIRYFMTIPEACQLVLEAGLMGNGGEIFIFDMGSPVKILDLAKKMIRLAGYNPEVDIKIIFTGLRPGEKLYEELLNQKEVTIPTTNPKIMIAKVREFDFDVVSEEIKTLINYGYTDKIYLTVSQMKKIVPEYISKNSPYEKLDL